MLAAVCAIISPSIASRKEIGSKLPLALAKIPARLVNFGVGGPYSNGHGQDENASIDEIIECAKAVALLTIRKLKVK